MLMILGCWKIVDTHFKKPTADYLLFWITRQWIFRFEGPVWLHTNSTSLESNYYLYNPLKILLCKGLLSYFFSLIKSKTPTLPLQSEYTISHNWQVCL